MDYFDRLYFNMLNEYKEIYKSKAKSIAYYYISFLQISLLILFGICLAFFLNEMNVRTMKQEKAWFVFIIAALIILFHNFIRYSGKKGKVVKANMHISKERSYGKFTLWIMPLCCLILAILIYTRL